MRAVMPNPSASDTFDGCKLLDDERHADCAPGRLHRDLLRLRREDPVLRELGTTNVQVESSAPTASLLLLRYITDAAHRLLVVNFADEHRSPMNDPLLAPAPGTRWEQRWSSEQPQYGGGGALSIPDANPWIIPASSAALMVSVTR
jgi:maltooligosyltrehalose trehalohydrolase